MSRGSAAARKVAERQIGPSRGERVRGLVREWSTAVLALLGWALVTSAAASLTSSVAWRLSAGLVLLALVGLKPIRTVVVEGLDRFIREEPRDA